MGEYAVPGIKTRLSICKEKDVETIHLAVNFFIPLKRELVSG